MKDILSVIPAEKQDFIKKNLSTLCGVIVGIATIIAAYSYSQRQVSLKPYIPDDVVNYVYLDVKELCRNTQIKNLIQEQFNHFCSKGGDTLWVQKCLSHWFNFRLNDITQLSMGQKSNKCVFFAGEISPKAMRQIKLFLQDFSFISLLVKDLPEIVRVKKNSSNEVFATQDGNTYIIDNKIVISFSDQGTFLCTTRKSDWEKYHKKTEESENSIQTKQEIFPYSQMLNGFLEKSPVFYTYGKDFPAKILGALNTKNIAFAAAVYYADGKSAARLKTRLLLESEFDTAKTEVRILDLYYTMLDEIFKGNKEQCKMFMNSLHLEKRGVELWGTMTLPINIVLSLISSSR